MKTFTKKHSKTLTKSSANNMAKSSAKTQQGFTLIELLVVVSILAALAGITSVAMDGYQQDAEEKITRVEMQRIAGAIRRFKADTGYWPKTGPFSYDTSHTEVSGTAPVASYPMTHYRDDYFNDAANFW
ncbi:MAG: prepilin-type N-terminal cleavage/methylation domain-containing protein, partial [Alteromonas sp.]|nr:prepilin-type N-terminal cleavage/methylation domain-containing protein [Alteromonas sp.]